MRDTGPGFRTQMLNAALVMAGVAAVGLTVANVRTTLFPPASESVAFIDSWRDYVGGSQQFGAIEPSVVVVVFSDYQCPFCGRLNDSLSQLIGTFPNDLRVVWRQFPLPGHDWGDRAARIAICAAGRSGSDAVRLHEMLFAEDSVTPALASLAGHGIVDLEACMWSDEAGRALTAETDHGRALGVGITPTFLVNGSMYYGAKRDVRWIVTTAVDSARGLQNE